MHVDPTATRYKGTNQKRVPIITGGETPSGVFLAARRVLPIVCADTIIKTEEGVLLGKRKNNPNKGEYFTMGGRIYFGETPEETAKRKAKEEVGLEVKIIRPVGVYNITYQKAYENERHPAHYIGYVFLAEKIGGRLSLKNKTSDFSEFVFINQVDQIPLHPQVKQEILDSGVFDKEQNKRRKIFLRNLFF